jgi:hypothetical protein
MDGKAPLNGALVDRYDNYIIIRYLIRFLAEDLIALSLLKRKG